MDISKINNEIDNLAKNGEFSGCILLRDNNKNTVYSYFGGYASKEYEIKNTLETKFNIASVGKSITGILVTKLIEESKINPSKSVSEYVNIKNSIFNQITIEQLLTHTSGLGDYFRQVFNTSCLSFYEKLCSYENLSDYLNIIEQATLEFTPGEKWAYSNLGYLVLGLVIESITGMSYRSCVGQEILIPANMTNSGFWLNDEPIRNRATGYDYDDERGLWRSITLIPILCGNSAGGCFSTVTDLSNFMDAVLNHKLLNKFYTGIAITSKPELNSPYYGYGFSVTNEKIRHGGNGMGASAQLTHYRLSGYTLVILCNYPKGSSEVEIIFDKYIL